MRKRNSNYIVTAVLAVIFFSCKNESNTPKDIVAAKRPNVILIMTDDQGYGDLACHGSPYVKTPALDSLYAESVRFTDFHVDPSCSPTRAAILTGNYSARAGVWHTIGGRSLLKEGMVTMPEVFASNGYETAVFGKWHLGENYPFRPQDRGFKEAIVHGGGGIGQGPDYWGNDYFDDTYKHNGKFEKYEGYCNEVWFDQAIEYIDENKENPFFCYLTTNLPHAPLHVDEKYVAPYRGEVSDRLANYYGMVDNIDENVKKLLNKIDEVGLKENTIVIFMTDNGPCPWFGGVEMDFDTGYIEEGYTAGMRGAKIWGYENAHRVPFFMRWPNGGISGGKDVDAIAAHIDIMPTLIDLCDLTTDSGLKLDGRSLAPILNKTIDKWPDERKLIVQNQRVEYPVKDKEYQVLTEEWRLVKRERNELYDIKKDPEQKHDVAHEHPEVIKRLYADYEAWWNDVSVGFDEYAKIHIGNPSEDPVGMYAHDAHSRNGKKIWVVDVEKAGTYEIRLNRWPEESGKRIVENKSGNAEVAVTDAWLKVGNIERRKKVDKDMTTVTFNVDINAGTTCIETAFHMPEEGKTLATQCMYVSYLGGLGEDDLNTYVASDPDEILKKGYEQNVIPYD
ncbi:arylsulfatase [Zobellia galactanivorans]|uniref:Sulfatase, family S1-17 n=1 Tax=Zobellia galactanivorans (strain DSM 12802 / CCUG 47099 / CIP 106680 / NCIMB 13871 / Dsij) TaxID=63186 RepID=G0L8K4_ZOBGA|nr:arylsulfatase [Zobellia galactanivorans]CAZ97640.1 Sulfatase, family S1-17 [Zobellia galactanivorans]